jgi:hypothetical protein
MLAKRRCYGYINQPSQSGWEFIYITNPPAGTNIQQVNLTSVSQLINKLKGNTSTNTTSCV